MKKISCTSCLTTQCFIQQCCSREWIQKADEKKIQILFKKNQNIINEGIPVQGIHFIQKGKVKVFFTGLNDKPQIVRFANDGHILGHRSLGTNDRYPITATAMENSLICIIDNETLNQIFLNNNKLAIGLMEFYSRELRKAEERIKNLTQMNLREKIAYVLISLYENFGLNEQNELNVLFTREDIACTAGTSAPMVSSQLKLFETEKLIKKQGAKTIALLNPAKLKKIVSEHNPHLITE